jgi:hypothetical protein
MIQPTSSARSLDGNVSGFSKISRKEKAISAALIPRARKVGPRSERAAYRWRAQKSASTHIRNLGER